MQRLKRIRQRQIDKLLRLFKNVPSVPAHGWIRTIREGLGMSVTQFAKRMGIAQPNASRLEKLEIRGRTTLETLSKAAEALGCNLVYAFIPKVPLEKYVERMAYQRASRILGYVAHSMALTNSGISDSELKKKVKELASELVQNADKTIWQ